MREDQFIPLCSNVSLNKPPRYFPAFYHKHDFFEMVYVLSGNYKNSFEDSEEELKTGDLCLIAPNTVHSVYTVNDDSIIFNILIRRSTFMDIFYNTVRDKSQISSFFVGNQYSREKYDIFFFIPKEIW